ncbi:NYN domain-containing protein [Amylibacter sp. IMCC11727]|nr:NYN domain-containing protein [Amylibacter sp. IMCC11727]WGI23587.1 NYN domain-containing protein [Amylibacter sp. IMCC11727]
MEADAPRLAVFIDGDNVSAAHAEAILEEISSFGEISLRRIYGDFSSSRMNKWSDNQVKFGIVAQHVPSTTTGKNASDIALVIDAIDQLHSGLYDGFFIVSSDGDYTRLAHRIREEGVFVYGIGEQKTPEAFRMACKRFIYIENLLPKSSTVSAAKTVSKADMNFAYNRIRTALLAVADDTGEAHLSQVVQELSKRYPDFDPRSYNKKRLLDLITEIKKFETTKRGNAVFVKEVGKSK